MNVLKPGALGETSLDRVAQCLRDLGFDCQIVKGEFASLSTWNGPMVLHLRGDDKGVGAAGHFGVAVWNAERNSLIAYDPLQSPEPIVVDPGQLAKRWSGHAILVDTNQPTELNVISGYTLAFYWIAAFTGGLAIGQIRIPRR
jgi:ABC-type bacteriocin/lantibiotic exporter with double-glycine peptidase domain